MARRKMRKTIRKLALKYLANRLLEDLPGMVQLDEDTVGRLTLMARAEWEETNWARQYPNTVPLVQVGDPPERRLELTFCERPDEPDLQEYVPEGEEE